MPTPDDPPAVRRAWPQPKPGVLAGGETFGAYVDAVRTVLDLVAGTDPPADVQQQAIAHLEAVADLLRPWAAEEADAPAGKRPDLPGRGHPLLVPHVIDEETADRIAGRVRFTRHFLGGNGAAHGGTLPLLFDEVLGRLANSGERPVARTAYLHTNYRRITPIGPELTFVAQVEREEGRKRYVSGVLRHGDDVVADAEGLFVVLLPGQP